MRVNLYGKSYRATVVHSSAHDRRRTERMKRQIAADKTIVETQVAALQKQTFSCQPNAAAAAAAVKNGTYHRCTAAVRKIPVYGRGRPPKTGSRTPEAVTYRVIATVEPLEQAIWAAEKAPGVLFCFLRTSNQIKNTAWMLRVLC